MVKQDDPKIRALLRGNKQKRLSISGSTRKNIQLALLDNEFTHLYGQLMGGHSNLVHTNMGQAHRLLWSAQSGQTMLIVVLHKH